MRFLRSQLRLYYITEDALVESPEFVSRCVKLIETGVTSIQLRYRGKLTDAIYAKFADVVNMCKSKNRYVFTTDDALLALRLGAHGVYFNRVPFNIERVREVLGVEHFIGAGISHISDFESHAIEPIDFAGVGPVLQFGNKYTQPIGTDAALHITKSLIEKPVFWLGGIRHEDVSTFGNEFADGIGVARCLEGENMEDVVRNLHSTLATHLGPSVWSVGRPPEDHTFRFSDLTTEQLKLGQVKVLN